MGKLNKLHRMSSLSHFGPRLYINIVVHKDVDLLTLGQPFVRWKQGSQNTGELASELTKHRRRKEHPASGLTTPAPVSVAAASVPIASVC